MSADLRRLLAHWHARRDQARWVLGTVFRTEGPCYRKPGAIMLLNDAGERFGLLSGGCLEADLALHAQRLLETGGAKTVSYDSREEGDIAYQLGLGCGGKVEILLQCIGQGEQGVEQGLEQDLGLGEVWGRLQAGEAGLLALEVPERSGPARGWLLTEADAPRRAERAWLVEREGVRQLMVPFRPEPSLLVVGGGVDARPVVAIADALGWAVTVCDPRPAFARPAHFPPSTRFHKAPTRELQGRRFDAAVVMSHNLTIDADALRWLRTQPTLRYLGLLGPAVRKRRVLALAELEETDFACALSGPAGLELGGELPGDIALSILAQCQQVLSGSVTWACGSASPSCDPAR